MKRKEIRNSTSQDMPEYRKYLGKRLLLLGNNIASIEILQIAKRLGAYTVAVDNTPCSPLKNIADKTYAINTADTDALLKLAKSEKIDAVMAGVSEFNIEKALTLSELLKLPFYTTRKQWNIMSNKEMFKKMCGKFDISVVDKFHLDSKFREKDLANIAYPVIIKPVDSSAGRGISVCKNEGELRVGYAKALLYSERKRIIFEKYMTSDQVGVYYIIQDGYIRLSAMVDKYFFIQEGVASVPLIYIYPSKHLIDFQKDDNQKFKNMLKYLKIKNGFLFIQGFFENGKIIPFESGYRMPGSKADKCIQAVNGINSLEMLVRFSLSGEMSGWDLKRDNNPNFKKPAICLHLILKPGKIKKISGLDEILKYPEVIDCEQIRFEGDTIDDAVIGTLHQLLLRIHLIADTKKLLIGLIRKIKNKLSVLDENGKNMLFDIDVEKYIQ